MRVLTQEKIAEIKNLHETVLQACTNIPDAPIEAIQEKLDLIDTIDHLQSQLNEATTSLEIANDCLFGNTHGDRALEEAYEVVHGFLFKDDTKEVTE